MASDVFKFSEFKNSARGLVARLVLPTNEVAENADILSIGYEVFNVTDGGASVTGAVDNDSVSDDLAEWAVDDIGYNFLWVAPGTLWPLAGKVYRVVVTFAIDADEPYNIIEVWEVTTKNPAA